ncbi:thiol:disulfide interchange protein DsbG [Paraburkholderia eburnea]|uniref:Thiol:disulfide interchange protein n=1 Tax=Paraburkholderia eburnea TaxID=1189126 RepID=A0A2S4M902_9BURK|nr:thioredoxin fold domain-containing protein [Paraburkholderia eburnea]POR51216.1 thiol:disulfide interchange protein DsbG [Paraburkholderia eburnea]PRZ21950.1 thiol:disulfide interchange protein DsbG [Paraburkholderia eburnea]
MKKWIYSLIAASALSAWGSAPVMAADEPAWLPASAAPRLQEASAIVEGASGANVKSTLYVFMDPNCIFCHLVWKALQPYEAAGLQVHWIPMGFLKPDSAGKAAALLQSKNRAALLKELETHYSEKDESGGIAPLAPVPASAQTQIDRNMQLFQDLGFEGTPTIIYQGSGGRWADLDGLPKLGMLPGILNLPAQPVTAPELQKYR